MFNLASPHGLVNKRWNSARFDVGRSLDTACTRTLHLGRFGMGFALYLVTSCFGIGRAFYRSVKNWRNELERCSADVKSSHYLAISEIEAANSEPWNGAFRGRALQRQISISSRKFPAANAAKFIGVPVGLSLGR